MNFMPLLVLAQDETPKPRGFDPTSIIFIVLIVVVLYFLILRPQKKKEKERKDMLSKVQRGDRVITIGGIHGEVTGVKEQSLIILVDRERGTTLKMNRNAIHRVVAKDSEEAEEQ